MHSGLSTFETSVALFSTPVANLLHFTRSINGKSSILIGNRCYGLQPLMTAMGMIKIF